MKNLASLGSIEFLAVSEGDGTICRWSLARLVYPSALSTDSKCIDPHSNFS